jgi:O-succinylbenzoate synthase
MRLELVELRRVRMPLVAPFRTSFGTETHRDALIVRALTDVGEGWGECVADVVPLYSSEYADGATHVLHHHLVPRLFALGDALTTEGVAGALAPVQGHPMAKGALEMAVLDAELRAAGRSFAQRLGAVRTRVDCGVSVGIQPSTDALLETVSAYLDAGYRRIKLKIEPGLDVEPVRAVRRLVGDHVLLQVDANAAYRWRDDDVAALRALDDFGLLLVEQPLPPDDLAGHAALAHELATPVCLDESITSHTTTALALDLGACTIVNIKAGRVGGYLEAVRIHDLCRERGVAVWCGGMLETGLGRAANVALAALPGFTLPGDTSASNRYFADDLTEPFVLDDGRLAVPTGPGLGVEPRAEQLAAYTTRLEVVSAV